MKSRMRLLSLIVLMALASMAWTQEQDQLSPASIQGLRADLTKAYQSYEPVGSMVDADLYPIAKARIGLAEELITKKPNSPETRQAFEACSLLTAASIIQMKAAVNRAKLAQRQDQTEAVLNELNTVHEEINQLESGRAAQLKAELDKARAEAQEKFNALQGELIKVSQDARGTIISMSDILFDVDKATLKPDLQTNLAKIAGILMVYKGPNVIVEGHTDNTGTEDYNQKLSEDRANNVMDYLVDQGVDASRLTAVGYAFRRPIADNRTREGRAQNRRVDLVIQDSD